MIARLILFASLAGGAHFFLGYWRALIASMAAQPLSEKFFVAAGLKNAAIRAEDFGRLLSLHRLMPDVKSQANSNGGLRAYYSAMKMLCGLPAVGGWAQNEMVVCTNCLATRVDQRLILNLERAAASRSF